MCNPMLIMMGVSTAVSVAGSVMQSNAAKRAANADAAQAEYQAIIERDNAQAEAQQIRRDGQRARGSTLASIAMSGATIGQGSTLDVERQVMQDTETDALMAILNGERRARGFNDAASRARRSGRDAQTASYFNVGTSLMSYGARFYSGASTPVGA